MSQEKAHQPQKLARVLNSHQVNSNDWWNEITDGEKQAIDEGIA